MSTSPDLILATDLDGTLLHPRTSRAGSELYRMLREHRDKIVLIFVTGRGYESILPLLDDPVIPVPDYIIADVGATVMRRQGETFTPMLPLQNDIAARWPGRDAVLRRVEHIAGLRLQDVPQECRCSFFFEDPSAVAQVQQVAKDMGLESLLSAGKYLDVLPQGVSKGDTLRRLATLEQLPQDRILVAGDTLNDLSLMQTGYRGVMVGNAEPALVQAVREAGDCVPQGPVYAARAFGPYGIMEAIQYHDFGPSLKPARYDQALLRGDADLVMVYHRQPFDELRQGDATVRRMPQSPNGILPTLLGFFAGGRPGAWVAWSLQENHAPGTFEQDVWVDRERYPNLLASRVALSRSDVDMFYQQFSKEALWPVIFSFAERATFDESQWLHFCAINKQFAERTAAVASHGATVWIHDYNLWMTPSYLRDLRPDLTICFFHHTAFPGADIFNMLPWKGQIIASLLKCDYVGFHIPRYVENFVDVVRSNVSAQVLERESCSPNWLTYGCALGVETMTRRLQTPHGTVGVGAHPVGIDNARIAELVRQEHTRLLVDKLLAEGRGRKIVLSVERLDYVKGPIEKMLAYEKFLERNPQLHEKVIMVNIVTPAAAGMAIYEQTREALDRVIGRINGRFSRLDWTPVRYFYRSMPFEELVAFYVASDVAWITPLRDGLNLVCKEYVSAKAASQTRGALVLSEFAGAAVELKGALLTNPYDENSMIQSLESAMALDEQECDYRMRQLAERVTHYDVAAWGEDFLRAVG